ncbi:Sin1 N-terminal [Trinorchestia longiramus]|nr:Sin1 N-terminal [Trinorchestia longiramus]
MAIFDDRAWLLSHIQNSYITSDDSGLSEMILQGDWPLEKITGSSFLSSDSIYDQRSDDDFLPKSPDVQSDQAYVSHRFRSDTEHRLQKLKKERALQSKIQRITWQANEAPLCESEEEELFGSKPIKLPVVNQPSLLSQLLDREDKLKQNPYSEYAQWDASTDLNVATRRLRIYVCPEPYRPPPRFPLPVVVRCSAKVIDVIGLTCYLYTRENLTPQLQLPASAFCLRIADEDGSVDWDFTPLLHSSTIDKFGFRVLAVSQERESDSDALDGPVTVTVNISGGVFSLIECETKSITLREVLQRTIAKRREMAKVVEAGVLYHLERDEDEPGKVLDLDRTIAETGSVNLHAVRDNSRRASPPEVEKLQEESEGLKCFSFPVTWVKKWSSRVEAIIDVSSDGVYVAATGGGPGSLLRAPNPVSYPSNRIVCCDIKPSTGGSGASRKSIAVVPGKDRSGDSSKRKGLVEVQLTCQGEQRFKDYVFECEESIAMELVEAVRKIKTEDSSNKKRDEDKPKRRSSIAGFRKMSRASISHRPH